MFIYTFYTNISQLFVLKKQTPCTLVILNYPVLFIYSLSKLLAHFVIL